MGTNIGAILKQKWRKGYYNEAARYSKCVALQEKKTNLFKASSMWNFSELPKLIFFWIFCVKTTNLTNFKHYSPILSDFLSFGTIFSIFKDFFDLEHFWKTQCSEIVCAFVWHPNTLKLNSIIKNISNFMKFITKIQETNF